MAKPLDTIKQPIDQELREFEKRFRDALRSPVPLMDRITYYIVQRKGKQVRPMFIFLSAKVCGTINDNSYVAASMVELPHTATLVHDDVVDESHQGRGFFSINALWKNKIAVLVGDYFLSRGLLIALKNKQYRILEIISVAMQTMAEGELLQSQKTRKLNITEDVYYDIIRRKTASLIAASCEAGAASVSEDADIHERMRLFGEKVGMAFQIRDDLFDFGFDAVGKPLGIDIKEKKLTLPLIHALEGVDRKKRREILNIVKRYNDDPKRVAEVIDFVRNSGGMEYARQVMFRYRDEAFEILHHFPDGDARQSLEQLVNFVVDRKK
ncbi:MAG: polyprenyl synthetase family protein [Bacteroidota bacterium]